MRLNPLKHRAQNLSLLRKISGVKLWQKQRIIENSTINIGPRIRMIKLRILLVQSFRIIFNKLFFLDWNRRLVV